VVPDQLQLADWLEELAVFGNPRRIHAAETAHHLCQVIRHAYLAGIGIESPRKNARKRVALQELDASLRVRDERGL